jgi:hypothetical protein
MSEQHALIDRWSARARELDELASSSGDLEYRARAIAQAAVFRECAEELRKALGDT